MKTPPLIEYINQKEASGELKLMKRLRIIDSKMLHYREVYLMVDAELVTGSSPNKTVAVTYVAEKLKIPESRVWLALKEVMLITL